MASQRSTTLLLQSSQVHEDYALATADKYSMDNWTIGKVPLAQAFGIDKGTISFPKLKPKLPRAAAKTQQAANAPAQDAGPPSDKQIRGNYNMGKEMAANMGWTGSQFTALNNLWTQESGWNTEADNPQSGAYGIPQALPGSKMASAGADWKTNPRTQIRWGLEYIRARYGTPERAWQHELAVGWY